MRIHRYILLLWSFFVVLFSGCSSQKGIPAAFYDCGVECMGTGKDGTQLVKSWGVGFNINEAVEQAKLNAIRTVLFKGISSGKSGCMLVPLIKVPEAEKQHQAYFDDFFKSGGQYSNFIVLSVDQSIDPKDRIKAGKQYKVAVIASVLHSSLRKELEKNGIVKPLGSGF
jgi:hypothetical protein